MHSDHYSRPDPPSFSPVIRVSSLNIWKDIYNLILMLSIIWCSYFFWFYRDFGLHYEDYYNLEWEIIHSKDFFKFLFSKENLLDLGRPLYNIFLRALIHLGYAMGGISMIYALVFIVIAIHLVLYYFLIKKIFGRTIAVFAGLAFCAFQADINRISISYVGMQWASILLICAFYFYLTGQKLFSYLLMFATLFTYELFFPIYFIAPILRWSDKPLAKLFKKLLSHAAIMSAAISLCIILRFILGEPRIYSFNFHTALKALPFNLTAGPALSIMSYIIRPLEAIWAIFFSKANSLEHHNLLIMSLVFFLSFWLININAFKRFDNLNDSILLKTKLLSVFGQQIFIQLNPVLIISLMAIFLSFPMLLVRDISFTGRQSMAFVAATFGASLFWACIAIFIMYAFYAYNKKRVGILFLSFYMAFSSGFGLFIQEGYIKNWRLRKKLFEKIEQLCPDMDTDDIILIKSNPLKIPSRPLHVSYASQDFNSKLYFPNEQHSDYPPIFALTLHWEDYVAYNNGSLTLYPSAVFYYGLGSSPIIAERNKIILLIETRSGLIKRQNVLIFNGDAIPIKAYENSEFRGQPLPFRSSG